MEILCNGQMLVAASLSCATIYGKVVQHVHGKVVFAYRGIFMYCCTATALCATSVYKHIVLEHFMQINNKAIGACFIRAGWFGVQWQRCRAII